MFQVATLEGTLFKNSLFLLSILLLPIPGLLHLEKNTEEWRMKPISLYCRAEDSAGHTTDGQKTLKCCALHFGADVQGNVWGFKLFVGVGTEACSGSASAGEHGEMKNKYCKWEQLTSSHSLCIDLYT